MNDKILFVDDEPSVLTGYQRALHKDFAIETAIGGSQGLALIESSGPFAVVVSDMRMPEMDGVQFLSRVSKTSPNTVRVILTGHADLDSVVNAVNERRIFRFLTKPCEAELLKKTLTTCLVQYRLVVAEKELLENTLMGSIKMLTDILSLANPAAFSRAVRVRRYVDHIARDRGLDRPWQLEMAAMLSQVGCITLATEVNEAAYLGQALDSEDQKAFDNHPAVAGKLISNIPRLEGIAWIVAHQRASARSMDREMPESVCDAAEILRVALAFDDLKVKGLGDADAIERLQLDNHFDQSAIRSLGTLPYDAVSMEVRAVRIAELATGMVLQEEIRTNFGMLLVGRGQEITYPLIVRLNNFHQRRTIPDKVMVLYPKAASASAS